MKVYCWKQWDILPPAQEKNIALFTPQHVVTALSQEHGCHLLSFLLLLLYFHCRACLALLLSQGNFLLIKILNEVVSTESVTTIMVLLGLKWTSKAPSFNPSAAGRVVNHETLVKGRHIMS